MDAAFDKSRETIARLVEVFEEVMRGRKALEFDEESTRVTLINPFWRALGWNVEDPREVVHEKRVATRKGTKRADYCFNVRGRPAFVVEAKEAGKKLTDPDSVFQAVRYGYNLPVPVAILTDFEEFRPFKSALEPVYENPARGLIKEFDLRYDQYLDRWEDVHGTFSREAVYDGSLEKLVGTTVRNKEALDRKFFERLTAWREELARVIALDNGDVSVHDLNEAVQRILDRIIFVRVIEDREIEPTELLQDAVNRWAREKEKPLYQYVTDVFRRLDPQYNGELFASHFSEQLLVRDKPLSDFVESLYYPLCPYQFNVIGVEMLGTIYERFLGSTIRLTPTHRAKVEEKPEVRKAGGVYYTPAYIVDYIVENTVGKLLDGCKTPKDVAKLKILDPACGSGSFLLGAFRRLIEWHEDYYNAHPEKISKPPKAECWLDREHPDGPRYRLTARAKGRILVNNIYGVDIDPQAVEVTVMSLYLKVLEDVDAGLLMKTALLPPLDGNVKCGNSLIGSDYWDFVRAEQGELFERTEAEERRVNPFDWDQEFGDIIRYKPGTRDLADGYGFDAVIGNPPYVRMEEFKSIKDYLKANYESHDERSDLYVYILEKGIGSVKDNGLLGLIVSNKFIRSKYGAKIRKVIGAKLEIKKLIDFAGLPVFHGATVRTVVLIGAKKPEYKSYRFLYLPPVNKSDFLTIEKGTKDIEELESAFGYYVDSQYIKEGVWLLKRKEETTLYNKIIQSHVKLIEYCDGAIFMGIKTGLRKAFVIDAAIKDRIVNANPNCSEIIKPCIRGRDIKRYSVLPEGDYLIYTYHGVDIEKYPEIVERLRPFKRKLEGRATKQKWYELQQPQYKFSFFMDKPKIIYPDIGTECRFILDSEGYYGDNTTYFIAKDDRYLLGILNSKLLNFYFVNACAALESGSTRYLRFFGQYLEGAPIKIIDFSDPADVEKHDLMVRLVDEMLDLHKRLAAAKSDADRTRLERAIKTTDRRIDALVYELYGLTEEEIRVVESS